MKHQSFTLSVALLFSASFCLTAGTIDRPATKRDATNHLLKLPTLTFLTAEDAKSHIASSVDCGANFFELPEGASVNPLVSLLPIFKRDAWPAILKQHYEPKAIVTGLQTTLHQLAERQGFYKEFNDVYKLCEKFDFSPHDFAQVLEKLSENADPVKRDDLIDMSESF